MKQQLNERMYTTEELKDFASKFTEFSKLTEKNIPGFDALEPDGLKYQVRYDLEKYNKLADEYNTLRKAMISGAVKDADVASSKSKLRSLYSKVKSVNRSLAKFMKKGVKTEKKQEVEAMRKKRVNEETDLHKSWVKKVEQYLRG